MTFGTIPADVDLKIRQIVASDPAHRKYENLVTEWKVRRKHDIGVIDTVNERMRFLLLVWANQNPDNPISQAILDAKHDGSLKQLNLVSSDMILRDNRALEDAGLFPKVEKVQPEMRQTALI